MNVAKCWTAALMLAWPAIAAAQTLRISPFPKGGKGGTLRIEMSAPDYSRPAAIQWTVVFPPGVSGSAGGTPAAGKTLSCAAVPAEKKLAALRCVLYGGQKTIPNGTVASIRYTVSGKPPKANAARLREVLGASPRGKAIEFSPGKR